MGWSLNYLAQVKELRGDYPQAAALYAQSLTVFEELGDTFASSDQCAHLANAARKMGDDGEARRLHRAGLRALRPLRNKPGLAKGLEGLAMLAADEGQPRRAARLFAAAHALREAIGTPVEVVDRAPREQTIAALRATLGEELFAATWAAGQALELEKAMTYALMERMRQCPPR